MTDFEHLWKRVIEARFLAAKDRSRMAEVQREAKKHYGCTLAGAKDALVVFASTDGQD